MKIYNYRFLFCYYKFSQALQSQFKIINYRDVKDNFELLHRAISL